MANKKQGPVSYYLKNAKSSRVGIATTAEMETYLGKLKVESIQNHSKSCREASQVQALGCVPQTTQL